MPESILILQNSPRKTAIVQEFLGSSDGAPFVTEWIRSCGAALDRLANRTKDDVSAVILDLQLSDGHELEILDRIIETLPHIPVLVLADSKREHLAKQAVHRGAQDYILDDQLDSHSLSKALHN